MQPAGQYGMPDMQQFVVGRGAPHLFAHSQDVPPVTQHRPHGQMLQHHHHPPQQSIPFHQHHSSPLRHEQSQPHQNDQLQQSSSLLHHHPQKPQPTPQQQLVQRLGIGSDSPEIPSALGAKPPPSQFPSVIPAIDSIDNDVEAAPEEDERGIGCNRWPREETIALLRIRLEMDMNFRDSGLKGPLWEEVSRKLVEFGYHRSAKKCKEKFENVYKYYKKTKDGKAGRQDGKNYRFFSELDALYAANEGRGVGGMTIAQGHGTAVHSLFGRGECRTQVEESGPSQRQEATSDLNLSSDSSGDDNDEPEEKNEETTKKRKRKPWSCAMQFFENLAKQMMEQQEALHQKFLETIDRREQERLIREEAYKRQEMARLNRDHELRAQEHALAASRDAALVAFLEKITGQTLQLPRMPLLPIFTILSEVQKDHEKEACDINTRRWPKVEVLTLIRIRSGMESRFQEAGPKAHMWEEISTSMARIGFNRNAKRCKEKWENINKYFRKTKNSCRKRPENSKTCPYFHQLELLYEKGVLTSPNSKFNKTDDQSEDLVENSMEDSEHAQGGDGEILSVVSARENGPAVDIPIGSPVVQLSANQKNGKCGDQNSKPVQILSDPKGSLTAPSGGNKTLQVEGFVKEIFEIQQQHQKLVDEYKRMEEAEEMRDQQRKKQQGAHLAQERSHSNTPNNAALMALVHKYAGDSTDFSSISTPLSLE